MFDEFDDMMRRMHIQLQRDMEHAFGKKALPAYKGKAVTPYRAPVTDLYQTENTIIATFELPGVDKKDIDLNVTEDAVEVKVEKKAKKEQKGKQSYAYTETSRCFYKAFKLPTKIDTGKVNAEYKNGMLRLELPKLKKTEKEGTRVQIK